MARKHAILSASGAHRWLACPGSVYLESLFPAETSVYAEEGTEAHDLAEKLLSYHLLKQETKLTKSLKIKLAELQAEVEKIHEDAKNNRKVKEMLNELQPYLDYLIDVYDRLKMEYIDTCIIIEQKLDFSNWVPRGFGTGDCIIIANKQLHVIDLKYGKGVQVSAVNNPQIRLYGLGALHEFGWLYQIEEIYLHIVQPRIDNFSVEHLTIDELLKWAEDVVVPKAKKAMASATAKSKKTYPHEYNPGLEQCKFCRARALCKSKAEFVLETVKSLGCENDD